MKKVTINLPGIEPLFWHTTQKNADALLDKLKYAAEQGGTYHGVIGPEAEGAKVGVVHIPDNSPYTIYIDNDD